MYTEKPTTSVKGNHGSVSLFKVAAEGAKSGFARLTMDENTGVFIYTPFGKIHLHVGYKGSGNVQATMYDIPEFELTLWGKDTTVITKDYDLPEVEAIEEPTVYGFHGELLKVGDRVTITGDAVEHELRYATGTIVGYRKSIDEGVAGWPLVHFAGVEHLHDGRGRCDRPIPEDKAYGRHLWYVHPNNVQMISRNKS